MSHEPCTNCGRLNCKGKCPIRSLPATAAPDQAKARTPDKTLNISIQRDLVGSGSTTSYPSSFQSTTRGRKRGAEASGSRGRTLLLDHSRKRATHDQWQSRTSEWVAEDRGVPQPLEYSFPQRDTGALGQQPTPISADPPRLQCSKCKKTNFGDKSKLVDHVRSHSKKRPFLCSRCPAGYKYKRDLVEHCRERCKFRDVTEPNPQNSVVQLPSPRRSSIAQGNQPQLHQSPSSYPYRIPSCADPPPENTPHDQSGFAARDEEPSAPSWPTPMDLDRVAQQTLDNRRPRLEDAISSAALVERQLDDDFEAWWRETYWDGAEPDTFGEMLGEESEFETCDYSDRAQDGGPSAEGKGA